MANPNSRFGFSGYGQGTYGNSPIENLPLGYYLSLITSQYQQSSPNFLAYLTVFLRKLDDISECLAGFVTAFDVDSAVGPQLDILGTIVGQVRTVGFQPSNSVSPVLDDTTYRTLIKAKRGRNQWDGTIGSLQGIWKGLFPGGSITIIDGQNMTANVIMTGVFSGIMMDLINNGLIVPRPAGVQYTYAYPTLPIFGFVTTPTAYVAGLGLGHFI